MHFFLSSLCSALGILITLLLCGQLFAVDVGSESTDNPVGNESTDNPVGNESTDNAVGNESTSNAGRSLGMGRSCTSSTAVSEPIRSAPSLQEHPDPLFSSLSLVFQYHGEQ